MPSKSIKFESFTYVLKINNLSFLERNNSESENIDSILKQTIQQSLALNNILNEDTHIIKLLNTRPHPTNAGWYCDVLKPIHRYNIF